MTNDFAASRTTGIVLWVVAVLVTVSAAAWQRRTGPSYPLRTSGILAGEALAARLPRSHVTSEDAKVEVPAPAAASSAVLLWRRYPTEAAFEPQAMQREKDRFVGRLPRQPPAGKVEYRVRIEGRNGGPPLLLPAADDDAVVLRYRGPVPAAILVPHIAAMFLAILVGTRAALAALLGRLEMRRLALLALGLLTAGGMVLGPLVQRFAFGELWTGWPNGHDLTDNKTLLMWLAWVAAAGVLLRVRRPDRAALRRVAVLVAFVVMIAVYLVPHSLRGSELDYDRFEEGVDPADAIRTG